MVKHSIDNRKSTSSSLVPSTRSIKKMGPLQFYVMVMNMIPDNMQTYRHMIYDKVVDCTASEQCSQQEAQDALQEVVDKIKLLIVLGD